MFCQPQKARDNVLACDKWRGGYEPLAAAPHIARQVHTTGFEYTVLARLMSLIEHHAMKKEVLDDRTFHLVEILFDT